MAMPNRGGVLRAIRLSEYGLAYLPRSVYGWQQPMADSPTRSPKEKILSDWVCHYAGYEN